MPIPTNKVYKAPPQGEIATHLPRGKMQWPAGGYEASTVRARKRTKRSKNPKLPATISKQELRDILFGEM